VWSTKADTDKSYYAGMRLGLGAVKERLGDESKPDVATIWATHNEISVEEAFKLIEEFGLGAPQHDGSFRLDDKAANRIAFAQLFGMKDNFTNHIAATLKADNGLPVVCKSVSYGDFEEAIPFLSRRAVENKTVTEGRRGAISERKRLGREVMGRLVPLYDYE
jgi:proline dehydrogenase